MNSITKTGIISLTFLYTCSFFSLSDGMEQTIQSIEWQDLSSDKKQLVTTLHSHNLQCLSAANNFYDSLSSVVDMVILMPDSSQKLSEFLSPLTSKRPQLLQNWSQKVSDIQTKIPFESKNFLFEKINNSLSGVYDNLLSIEAEYQKQCNQSDINSLELKTLSSLIKNYKDQIIPQNFGGNTLSSITHWLWPEIKITEKPRTITPPPTPNVPEAPLALSDTLNTLSSSSSTEEPIKIIETQTPIIVSEKTDLPQPTDENMSQSHVTTFTLENMMELQPPQMPKEVESSKVKAPLKKENDSNDHAALSSPEHTTPAKNSPEERLKTEYRSLINSWTSPYSPYVIDSVERPWFTFSAENATKEERMLRIICDIAKEASTTPSGVIITTVKLPAKSKAVYLHKNTHKSFIKLSIRHVTLLCGEKERDLFDRQSHELIDYALFTNFILDEGNVKYQQGLSILRGIDS